MKRRTAMHATKRKRVEAAGWRVGSVQEFLGLTDREVILIDMRLALAAAVRSRRARRGLTQLELARSLKSSQSRIAKMEAGEAGVSFDLMILALLGLGATPRGIGRILSARAA